MAKPIVIDGKHYRMRRGKMWRFHLSGLAKYQATRKRIVVKKPDASIKSTAENVVGVGSAKQHTKGVLEL